MNDHLEVALWFMLERQHSVAAVDLCPWDEQRAERVLAAARCYQHSPGLWGPTAETRAWSESMSRELRGLPLATEAEEPTNDVADHRPLLRRRDIRLSRRA